MRKQRILSALLAFMSCLVLLVQTAAAATAAVSGWAQADVAAAAAAGLVPEGLPGDFTQGITRAQFCLLGVTLYEQATGQTIDGRAHFSDTDDPNVEKLAYLGVVSGTGDSVFSPDSTITRQEAATILARLSWPMDVILTSGPHLFADGGEIAGWARTSVAQVYGSGIMLGTSADTFSPLAPYTIEQSVITMLRLYRLYEAQAPQPEETEPEETEPDQPPTLANGQPVTEENVRAIILGLRDTYPDGTYWTNNDVYYSETLRYGGMGCEAFALICSDAAFGSLPVTRMHNDFDAIRVGDMVRVNNNTHTVIVLEKHEDYIVVTEGNVSSIILWGRAYSRQQLEEGNFFVRTRYPV